MHELARDDVLRRQRRDLHHRSAAERLQSGLSGLLRLIAGGHGRASAPCSGCSHGMDAAFVLLGRLTMIMKVGTPASNLVLV